ncbi:MAG: amidase, partial [Sphingomonadales bacterium]|nr:amidase [Sphingomonadales bacterium]
MPKRADTLNAFIARSEAGAPKEIGDGPLAGLTLAAKDNIETRDFATTAGTPALAANRPARNAPAVQQLLDAGAALLGKTNMHELAFGITSRNAHFGAVVNPYD